MNGRLLSLGLGVILTAVAAATLAASGGASPAPPGKTGDAAGAPQEVILWGRVVCLSEEMHRLYLTELPADHPHQFGFRDSSGTYYTLLRTRFSEALFTDARVRDLDLVLKARLLPDSQVLEVSGFSGVRDGKGQDIYYYCELCSIRSPEPGLCPCCREEFELKVESTEAPAPKPRPPAPPGRHR